MEVHCKPVRHSVSWSEDQRGAPLMRHTALGGEVSEASASTPRKEPPPRRRARGQSPALSRTCL
eukprot:60132-Alexandrium_andersonii.AAC.1